MCVSETERAGVYSATAGLWSQRTIFRSWFLSFTLLRQGLLVSAAVLCSSGWLAFEFLGDSPVFASHLAVGVPGLLTHATTSIFLCGLGGSKTQLTRPACLVPLLVEPSSQFHCVVLWKMRILFQIPRGYKLRAISEMTSCCLFPTSCCLFNTVPSHSQLSPRNWSQGLRHIFDESLKITMKKQS